MLCNRFAQMEMSSPIVLLIGWNFRHFKKPSFLVVALETKLELQDDCLENLLRLLGICYSLHFCIFSGLFFFFLCTLGAVRPSVSTRSQIGCHCCCLARVWWLVGNLDESRIFLRF